MKSRNGKRIRSYACWTELSPIKQTELKLRTLKSQRRRKEVSGKKPCLPTGHITRSLGTCNSTNPKEEATQGTALTDPIEASINYSLSVKTLLDIRIGS